MLAWVKWEPWTGHGGTLYLLPAQTALLSLPPPYLKPPPANPRWDKGPSHLSAALWRWGDGPHTPDKWYLLSFIGSGLWKGGVCGLVIYGNQNGPSGDSVMMTYQTSSLRCLEHDMRSRKTRGDSSLLAKRFGPFAIADTLCTVIHYYMLSEYKSLNNSKCHFMYKSKFQAIIQ